MSCLCKKVVNIFESASTPYRIGKTGENVYQEIEFNFSKWLSEYPDAKIDLLIRAPKNGYYLLAEGITEPIYLWKPSAFDLANPGRATVMARMTAGEVRAKSDPVSFEIVRAMDYNLDISEPGPTRPSLMDEWIEDIYDAAARYPKIGEDGYWYVWDVVEEDWVKTDTSASGEIPQEEIEQVINDYFNEHPVRDSNAVHYDESESLTTEQKEQARDNIGAGTYSKPSGGIPATDLEPNVIPSVPQMATSTDMSDWTSGKTVDAEVLKDKINDLKSGKADKSELPDLTGYATETWVEGRGYQTAPFVIPTTKNGDNWTTTASAEDIIANINNCAIHSLDGLLLPVVASAILGEHSAMAFFTLLGTFDGYIGVETWMVTAYGNSVTIENYEQSIASEQYVQTAIDNIPDELPSVAAADNGKFLRVVNGAWAAQTVPSAESSSFGGGS